MSASLVFVELRPAATVILVRESLRGDGAEVLMLERSLDLDFAGGAFVFPGGAVDDGDSFLNDACAGVTQDEASERLSLQKDGLKFYVAAIRECFEEAGVLLATSRGESRLNSASGHLGLRESRTREKYEDLRKVLNSGEISFSQLVMQNDLILTVSDLHYMSHWITPLGRSRRYDTRFFIALAPQDQDALHDNGEAVNSMWISPEKALRLFERREINLVFPTIRSLEQLRRLGSVDEIITWVSSLEDIPVNAPRIVYDGGIPKVILPGEELL